MADHAQALLSGPRGRRLCWELIDCDSGHPGWSRVWDAASTGDLSGHARDLADAIAATDLSALAATSEELELLPALGRTAALAMYWQAPDPEDVALENGAVRDALLPLAHAATAAPAAQWWPSSIALDSQHTAEWPGMDDEASRSAWVDLATWRSRTLADEEQAASRPADPAASWSGNWWSTPAGLLATTRALPGVGAVGLAVMEDSCGWNQATCRPIESNAGARVYEITGPDSWADLVARYPLDVTKSRRHDWWRVSGWSGTWLIPDFAAVANDYDAVHLSVLGYLSTAGRALPAGDARTVLAGWDPDKTYWLNDVLRFCGPAANWVLLQDGPVDRWSPVTQ